MTKLELKKILKLKKISLRSVSLAIGKESGYFSNMKNEQEIPNRIQEKIKKFLGLESRFGGLEHSELLCIFKDLLLEQERIGKDLKVVSSLLLED